MTGSNSQTGNAHKWLISILGSCRRTAAESHITKLAVAIGSCTT